MVRKTERKSRSLSFSLLQYYVTFHLYRFN